MLIVDARESDSLERALKVFKKKFEKAGIVKELRRRQAFTLPSVNKRTTKLKAIYRDSLRREEA